MERMRGRALCLVWALGGFGASGAEEAAKEGQELFIHIRGDGREKLCLFRNDALPPIAEGRIGLRHMYTRGARYRDFRVSVPAPPQDVREDRLP